jgi:phage gpG-like protein
MSQVGIEWRFPALEQLVKSHQEEISLFIAAQLQTNRGLMFDESNAGRPTPWKKPLLRDGQPLSQGGELRRSFAPKNDGQRPGQGPSGIVRIAGEAITIGTSLAYADILNNGGIIRPKRFPVLWIPLPNGSAKSSNAPSKLAKHIKSGKSGAPIVKGKNGITYLLAKKATIPARPMDEWTADDQLEVETALRNKLEALLNTLAN